MVGDQLFTQVVPGLAVGRCMGIFYDDYGMVVSQDLEWIQGALNMLIDLLRSYGLVENLAKSKARTCQTVKLRYGISEEAVG